MLLCSSYGKPTTLRMPGIIQTTLLYVPKKGKQPNKKNPLTKQLSRLGSTRPLFTQNSVNQVTSLERLPGTNRYWSPGLAASDQNKPIPKLHPRRSRVLIRYLIANSIALLVTAKASKADTCTIVGKEGLSGESATAKLLRDSTCTFQEPCS